MNENHGITSLDLEPKMSINQAAALFGVTKQAIHQKLRAKNVSCKKSGRNSYISFNVARDLFEIKFNKKIIAMSLVKGGTGKTTSTDNIGSCANLYGAKVLKIDADPQGNLTDANGIDADEMPVIIDVLNGEATIQETIVNISPGLDLIPSRIENVVIDNKITFDKLPLDRFFKSLLDPIIDNYDFIFIDLPPTLGSVVTAAALFTDVLVAPLNPDKFSAKGLKILREEIGKLKKHYGKEINYKVFLNKYSGNTILSGKAYESLMKPEMEGRVLQTAVRQTQEIPNLTDMNKNLFSSLKKSFTRDDYDQLARELLEISFNK